jgi:hypothetical protein
MTANPLVNRTRNSICTIVERWALANGLPARFLPSLERDAPWVFCSDGMSEELAPQLLAEVFAPYNLSATDAQLFARLLNAHTEYEAPSQVPERVASAEKMKQLLIAWQATAQPGEPGMWLGSTASFGPTVHVAGTTLPPKRLIVELQAAAQECPYYNRLVFAGPGMQELAIIELRSNDG